MNSRPRGPLKVAPLISAWGRILKGFSPLLSIEITRRCPLRCSGCYAYGDDHLGGAITLRQLRDLRGQALIEGVLNLVREHRPVQVSFVGGEPLVRHRELSRILPILSRWNVQERKLDISWVITNQMMSRRGYLDEYLHLWTSKPEIGRIWMSIYTPQKGERSPEMLTPDSRRRLLDASIENPIRPGPEGRPVHRCPAQDRTSTGSRP